MNELEKKLLKDKWFEIKIKAKIGDKKIHKISINLLSLYEYDLCLLIDEALEKIDVEYCSCSFDETQNYCDCNCGNWNGEYEILEVGDLK